jgi:DNA replication and repair protein RecF
MLLTKITLQNYRNYEYVDMRIHNNVNIFIGDNAQGKTNLLESIYVLSMTRSHRTHQEKDVIRWNAEETKINAEIKKKYGEYRLDVNISSRGKKVKINGLEQKKVSNYIGSLNVVMFAPEDLDIVKGAPSIRRRFLDMEIGQVYPSYIYDLLQYQKVLLQRNNFLKHSNVMTSQTEIMLTVWNEQLANYGIRIIQRRLNFIEKLQKWVNFIHAGITNHKEIIKIHYMTSININENEVDSVLFEQYMVKLTHIKEQELKRGVTLLGPHRDDLLFTINEKDVKTFGSQGQQRTVALSLKLAEIELIHEEIGEYPILLLDDVLSELDESRQTQLIQTFQEKVQTFITTTSLKGVHLNKLHNAEIYQVENGKVNR